MKAETQANNLASLVKRKKKYPEYELILPLMHVKSSKLQKLAVDDVILLGLNYLDLYLLSETNEMAKVDLISKDNREKIKISYLEKDTLKQEHTKKYELLKCSFSKIQVRKFEVGFEVTTEEVNLQELKLFVEGKNIATATLVKVDGEIAIQVIKVEK
jgi:hypothetical protein